MHLVHVPSLQLGVEVRKVGVGRELRKPVKARRSATLPGRSATFAFYPQLANLYHHFNQQTPAPLTSTLGAQTSAAEL